MVRVSILFFLLVTGIAHAQFTYVQDQSIPVQDMSGNTLSMPWTGGLNATQYNTMDLDHDGVDDLVLFDRMANKVITLLRKTDQFQYAPEYESSFPQEITNWLLLRDFNCDGKKDIFTSEVGGIRVYTNITIEGALPSWQLFTNYYGKESTSLLTQGFSLVNLQLQPDDLPAIDDVDGDGDLDIFNMQYAANGTIEFHQNLSQESGLGCDSLKFKRSLPRQWAGIRECSCGTFAFNGDDCPTGGRTKHAGGKSLLALDADGDQKLDLIFSEASCAQLFQLNNEGTVLNPVVNSADDFPASTPVNLLIFPAAYYEDVDYDGKKDLIASPNIFSKTFLQSKLDKSNWFYKNSGTTASPVFNFVKDNFLQEGMIDVGDNSIPAFADFDGDGDQDLFISRNSSDEFAATIFQYENTGGPGTPAFRLRTDDYLNLSFTDFYNLKIQFADIDNNNTTDLVFTATNFQNGGTNLYYILNKSTSTLDFSEQVIGFINFSMSSQENLHMTDVNSDGNIDILVGRSNGSLEYWKNTGGLGFDFTLADENFLGLDASVLRLNIACTVSDLNDDGKKDLIYGDQTGVLKLISDYRNAPDDAEIKTELIYHTFTKTYAAQNLGGRIWPTIAKIFHGAKPSIMVGNILGGIQILRNENEFSIYPNPIVNEDPLNIEVDEPTELHIYSMRGVEVIEPIMLAGDDVLSVQLPQLATGMYIFRFVSSSRIITKKIVVK